MLVTSIWSRPTELENYRPRRRRHFDDHGFHTVPDSEGVGIVQLRIDADDQHPLHGCVIGMPAQVRDACEARQARGPAMRRAGRLER